MRDFYISNFAGVDKNRIFAMLLPKALHSNVIDYAIFRVSFWLRCTSVC